MEFRYRYTTLGSVAFAQYVNNVHTYSLTKPPQHVCPRWRRPNVAPAGEYMRTVREILEGEAE